MLPVNKIYKIGIHDILDNILNSPKKILLRKKNCLKNLKCCRVRLTYYVMRALVTGDFFLYRFDDEIQKI